MILNRTSAALHAGLLLAGSALAFPAFAQDIAADGAADGTAAEQVDDAFGTIIVTAQRKAQTLQDVPVALSVVSSETVRDYNVTEIAQLAQFVPTVKVGQGTVTDVISIRGFGSGSNLGFEQAVPTFVGGSYRNRAVSNRLSLFDIERVEILKGPQTTYFGANATAGAFVITPKAPELGELDAQASTFVGLEYDEFTIEGGVNVPLGDKFAVRLAAKYDKSDGYIYNSFIDDMGPRRKNYALRGTILFEPDDGFSSTLRIEYGKVKTYGDIDAELQFCSATERPFGLGPRGQCAAYLAYAAANGFTPDDQLDWRANTPTSHFLGDYKEFEWNNVLDIGTGTLTATSVYYTHDYDRLGNPLPLPMPNNLGQPYLLPTRIYEDFKQFTQEFRWNQSIGERLDYTAGVYYLYNDLSIRNFTGLLFNTALPPGTGAYLRQQQVQETYSFYGIVDYQLTDPLTVSLGLRYSNISKQAHRQQDVAFDSSLPPGEDLPIPYPAAQQAALAKALGYVLTDFPNPNMDFDGFMPSATIQYDFNRDVMAYAKFVMGFKAGGFAFTNNINTFDKEKVKSFEVGLRGSFARQLNFSLIGFWMDFDGLQESANRTNPNTGAIESFVDNVGSARAKGVELTLNWMPVEGLNLLGDVAYLDSKYQSYPNATCDQITMAQTGKMVCDLSGRTRQYSPKWSGNIRANFTTNIGFADAFIEPGLEFSAKYYTLATLEPVSLQDAYTKVNLRVGLQDLDSRWTLALVGRNLTNTKTSDFRNILPASAGSGAAVLAPGRQIALQASWRL